MKYKNSIHPIRRSYLETESIWVHLQDPGGSPDAGLCGVGGKTMIHMQARGAG